MSDHLKAVEYAGYLLGSEFGASDNHPMGKGYGGAATHPQFRHIQLPPDGYIFTQNPRPQNKYYAQFLTQLVEGLEQNQPIPGINQQAYQTHQALLQEWVEKAQLYGASFDDIKRYLSNHNLLEQTQLGTDVNLAFIPTVPYSIGLTPWVIEIEDSTTLFYPYLQNGNTAECAIWELWCFPIVKALLESSSCQAIITHIESTADTLPILFQSQIIKSKVVYSPIGIELPNLQQPRDSKKTSINLLFSNSWHQIPNSFFLRGGHDVLEAFAILAERYPNLNLIIRSQLPELNSRQLELVKNHPRIQVLDRFLSDAELEKLMLETDIYLVPAARIHVVSVLKAMAYEIPVIASDGWGFLECIEHEVNGFLLPGRYGKVSWIDPVNGMLREDYSSIRHPDGINATVISGLVETVSRLVENPELKTEMGRKARLTVEQKFTIANWNTALEKAFNPVFCEPSALSRQQAKRTALEMERLNYETYVAQLELAQYREKLEKALSRAAKHPEYSLPTLLETFADYNLVAWGNSFYALPCSLGTIDLASDDLEQLEGIVVAQSLEALKQHIQDHFNLRQELESTRSQLQHTAAELVRSQQTAATLTATVERLTNRLANLQDRLTHKQERLKVTKVKLKQSRATIRAMERSKVWKIQKAWSRLKQAIGLSKE